VAFKNILVPVDFSDTSLAAVRLAVQVAKSSGGTVSLLHVGTDPAPYMASMGSPGAAGEVLRGLARDLKAEQEHQLQRLARQEVPEPNQGTQTVCSGYPPTLICERAAEGGHDLLVLGTHGYTGVKHVFLGSVAERVIRHASVPVLVTH